MARTTEQPDLFAARPDALAGGDPTSPENMAAYARRRLDEIERTLEGRDTPPWKPENCRGWVMIAHNATLYLPPEERPARRAAIRAALTRVGLPVARPDHPPDQPISVDDLIPTV